MCGCTILGLGSWTLSERWYYIHLVDDTTYQVASTKAHRLSVVTPAEHEPAVDADRAGCSTDGDPGLHRGHHQQQDSAGVGKSDIISHYHTILTPLSQYTILVVIVFVFEAVLGLMSYLLQDRLREDLGDFLVFEKYKHDHLVRASVDQVQIQVENSLMMINHNFLCVLSVPLLWCQQLP